MKVRSDRGSASAGALVFSLFFLVLAAAFFFGFYIPNWAPYTHPTDHTNFWYGLIHGFLALPTFVYSLFSHDVTIYQSPNNGNWYNFGYVLGAGILLGGARSSR